jgi:AraC-like DNA-binding protein
MEFEAPAWQVMKAAAYRVNAPILGPEHHHRDQYQVFSVSDAQGTLHIGGQAFDARLAGIFWIPPGTPHASEQPPACCPHMVEVRFRPNRARLKAWGAPEFPYHIQTRSFPQVPDLLRRIVDEYWGRKSYWQWTVSALIDQFVIELIRALSATTELKDRHAYGYRVDPEGIERAVHFIHEHYAEPIELEALARAAAMSVSRFAKTFKAMTGKRPIEYLIEFRLQRAMEMLRDGDWTISQVSEAVGFNSIHYFSRSFRKCFGVPPSLRAQMEQEEMATGRAGTGR